MPTLKPLKVTLVRRTHANGERSVWPDFPQAFQTDPSAFNGKRPSNFFDEDGIGWHTNKIANLGTGAPNGEAYTAVPPANADAILALGIEGVSAVADEAEMESFWDEKSHVVESEEIVNVEVLQGIAAKRDLGMRESAADRAALDPDNPTLGVRKNPNKTWARFKAAREITLTFV